MLAFLVVACHSPDETHPDPEPIQELSTPWAAFPTARSARDLKFLDDDRVVAVHERTLLLGRPHLPRSMWALAELPGDVAWWEPTPAADGVVLVLTDGIALRYDLDGDATSLGRLDAPPRWGEWVGDELLLAIPGSDALRVVWLRPDGTQETLTKFPGAEDVVLGADLEPRFLLDRTRERHGRGLFFDRIQVRDAAGRDLGPPLVQPAWVLDRLPVPPVGDGDVHLLAGFDRVGLVRLTERGPETVWSPTWGDALMLEPGIAVGELGARTRWHALSDDAHDLRRVADLLNADVRLLDRSPDDRRWALVAESGSRWPTAFVYDRDFGELHQHDDPPPRPLARVEPLVLRMRDGLEVSAYLTRPEGQGPWPLVMEVHGGPWAGRHRWVVDGPAQRWAERGYATLVVNFRGTHGWGWSLVKSSRVGAEMIEDLHDALDHVIEAGIADPKRVAMVGASYGGYATLRFLTAERPRIRCGVAGLTYGNLTTEGSGLNMASVGPLAWREAHSPDRFTHRMTAPALIWTGGRDGDNPDSIAAFVERAEANGKRVTWLRFPNEGHGLDNQANTRAMEIVQDRFLAACLGGPAWPWDLTGAEVEVRAGSEHIPGLLEAIEAVSETNL